MWNCEFNKRTVILLILLPGLGTSWIDSCTNETSLCPITEESWLKRTIEYNCQQFNYTCIRTTTNTLVEGCIPDYDVSRGLGRCPEVISCHGTSPVLSVEQSFKECPQEVYGCPRKNHSVFTVQELYKYPACLVRNFTDLRQTGITASVKTTVRQAQSSTKFYGAGATDTSGTNNIASDSKYTISLIVCSLLFDVIIIAIIIIALFKRRVKFWQELNQREPASFKLIKTDDVENCLAVHETDSVELLKRKLHEVNRHLTMTVPLSPLQTCSKHRFEEIFVSPIILSDHRFTDKNLKDEDIDYENRRDENTEINDFESQSYKEQKKQKHLKDVFYKNGIQVHRIFLLGDAGNGKTTYCKWLVRQCCNTERCGCPGSSYTCLEDCHTDFDFVFFIPFNKMNKSIDSVEEMICEYILVNESHLHNELRHVLSSHRYRCLIILDGLDEWNPNKSVQEKLKHNGFPNIGKTSNCVIIITMRHWRFEAVLEMVRSSDKVLQILGIDSDGIKSLTQKLLVNLCGMNLEAEIYNNTCKEISEKAKDPVLMSAMQNPLFASSFIQLWYMYRRDKTLTDTFVSILGMLIEIAEQRHENLKSSSGLIDGSVVPYMFLHENYYISKSIFVLQKIGRIAFHGTLSGIYSFTYQADSLAIKMGLTETELNFLLKVGLVTRKEANSAITRNVWVSFFHPTMQDFLAAMYVITTDYIRELLYQAISDVDKILNLSTVLIFTSGLSPSIGIEIIRKIESAIQNMEVMTHSEAFEHSTKLKSLHSSCSNEIQSVSSRESQCHDSLEDAEDCPMQSNVLTLRI